MVGMKPSLIPKKNRKLIYESLFKEGVIVVEKNPRLPKHPHIDVPNLHVMLALRSLKSRDFVDEKFNWRHHYYFLKNDGTEHLRSYLCLPTNVHPNTVQKSKKPTGWQDGARADESATWRGDRDGGRGRARGRGYRRDDEGGDFRGGSWNRAPKDDFGAPPKDETGGWGAAPPAT